MTTADDERFSFGSRVGLDLTWTLRFRSVQPTELLGTTDDLAGWAQAADLPVGSEPTGADLAATRNLREAIYGAARNVIDGVAINPGDRATINKAAAFPVPAPQLGVDGNCVPEVARDSFAPVLAVVARDAIGVLTAGDGRLRLCADELCSLVFYDESRPGQRRWCSTARCGNRANTRAYRQRSLGQTAPRQATSQQATVRQPKGGE